MLIVWRVCFGLWFIFLNELVMSLLSSLMLLIVSVIMFVWVLSLVMMMSMIVRISFGMLWMLMSSSCVVLWVFEFGVMLWVVRDLSRSEGSSVSMVVVSVIVIVLCIVLIMVFVL